MQPSIITKKVTQNTRTTTLSLHEHSDYHMELSRINLIFAPKFEHTNVW